MGSNISRVMTFLGHGLAVRPNIGRSYLAQEADSRVVTSVLEERLTSQPQHRQLAYRKPRSEHHHQVRFSASASDTSTVTSYSSGHTSDNDNDDDDCDSVSEEDSEEASARIRSSCWSTIKQEEDCDCCDACLDRTRSSCCSCFRRPSLCHKLSRSESPPIPKLPRDDPPTTAAKNGNKGNGVEVCPGGQLPQTDDHVVCALCRSLVQRIRRFRSCVCDLVEFRENGNKF